MIRTPPADPYTARVERHDDGRFYATVSHPNGDVVLVTPPKQQYENEGDVLAVLTAALHFGPHIVVDSQGRTVQPPKFGWRRFRPRRGRRR